MPKFFSDIYDVCRMPPQFHIPIAAKSENAISQFVGKTRRVRKGNRRTGERINAIEVQPMRVLQLPKQHPFLKCLGGQYIFNTGTPQYWVHVDNNAYAKHYKADFEIVRLDGESFDLDHVLSARVARWNHFKFVRLHPVVSAVNRGAGAFEKSQLKALSEDHGINASFDKLPQGDPDPSSHTIAFASALALCKLLGEPIGSTESLHGLRWVESVLSGHD